MRQLKHKTCACACVNACVCVERLMHWRHQQVFFGDGFSYERSFIEEYVRQTVHPISPDSVHPITIKAKVPSPRYERDIVV